MSFERRKRITIDILDEIEEATSKDWNEEKKKVHMRMAKMVSELKENEGEKELLACIGAVMMAFRGIITEEVKAALLEDLLKNSPNP